MRRLQIKQGADIRGLHIAMRRVLIAADQFTEKQGVSLVVTSGLDGEHSAGSLHYYGRAIDLRIRDLKKSHQRRFLEFMKAALGADYDVVLERTHLHVEYQPR